VASFDEVIPPGKAGTIKASIHTANLKGAIGKSITVTHDDTTQEAIVLSVTAKVVGSVDVFPFAALQLARHRRGFENPAKLLVRKDATEQGTSRSTASQRASRGSRRARARSRPPSPWTVFRQPSRGTTSVRAGRNRSCRKPYGKRHLQDRSCARAQLTIPVTIVDQPAVTLQPALLALTPTADAPTARRGKCWPRFARISTRRR
jgi:hypothetical protein